MNAERTKIAIVGCGRIARVHARNLAPDARLVFASRRVASAEALAERFSGEALPSLEAVLDRRDIRAVAVCSPLEHHAAQTVAALGAGKSVLVEKPMAASPAEVEEIGRALAGKPPGALMVAENYLYRPSLGRLRSWLPEIGAIRRVRLEKRTLQEPSDWRSGHGALLEGGIHFAALLGALVEETPEEVRAEFPGGRDPERRAEVTALYPSGIRGEIGYAWDARSLPGGVLQHSTIRGDDGRIVFESNGLYAFARIGREFRFRAGPWSDLMGFGAMTRDFLRSVRDPERRPRSHFGRARRDLGLVFRAYRCGRQNIPPGSPPPETGSAGAPHPSGLAGS